MGSLTCDWCGCEHSDDADYSCCDCGRELDTMYPTTPQNPEWCKGCGYAPGNCHCAKPAPAQLSPEMLGVIKRARKYVAELRPFYEAFLRQSQYEKSREESLERLDGLIQTLTELDHILDGKCVQCGSKSGPNHQCADGFAPEDNRNY